MTISGCDIVNNVESDYGVDLSDYDSPLDVLCYNERCNENCDCVDAFYRIVRDEAESRLCTSCDDQVPYLCVLAEDHRLCPACYCVYYDAVMGAMRGAIAV